MIFPEYVTEEFVDMFEQVNSDYIKTYRDTQERYNLNPNAQTTEAMNELNELIEKQWNNFIRSKSTGADESTVDNSYPLWIVGSLLILGAAVVAGKLYYDRQAQKTSFYWHKSIVINRQVYHNAIVNTQREIVMDYKDRALINVQVADDGKTLLFNGQPIVVKMNEKLVSFDKKKLFLSPTGNIYTPRGSLHRGVTPKPLPSSEIAV